MIPNDELRVILTEFLVWLYTSPHDPPRPGEKVSEIINEFIEYRNMK